jgi:hypothetical protein
MTNGTFDELTGIVEKGILPDRPRGPPGSGI